MTKKHGSLRASRVLAREKGRSPGRLRGLDFLGVREDKGVGLRLREERFASRRMANRGHGLGLMKRA